VTRDVDPQSCCRTRGLPRVDADQRRGETRPLAHRAWVDGGHPPSMGHARPGPGRQCHWLMKRGGRGAPSAAPWRSRSSRSGCLRPGAGGTA